MKIIDFSKLYELDFNLKSLFAVKQHWKENSYFKMSNPRKTSCLLLFCGCSAKYKFDDDELIVPRHSVIYIPEGAVYESLFFDCKNSVPATILIEFGLYLPDGSSFCASNAPMLLKNEAGLMISELFNEATDIYIHSR